MAMPNVAPSVGPSATPYLRTEPGGNYTWILAAIGLVAFAAGEMGAFFAALSLIGAMAVMYDFRIGAVLLLIMLPMGATHLFPHSLMGIPGLNPNNVLVLAMLAS